MQKIILQIVLTVMTSVVMVKADDIDITVSIVVPLESHGERRISYRTSGTEWDRAAHFHVIISNRSNKPQKIWQESYSEGYFALSFEFVDDTGKKWEAKKIGQPFVNNRPSYWILEPNESAVFEVYYADLAIWKGFPQPEAGQRITGSMRAILDMGARPPFSKEKDIWRGKAVSEAQRITFYKPK